MSLLMSGVFRKLLAKAENVLETSGVSLRLWHNLCIIIFEIIVNRWLKVDFLFLNNCFITCNLAFTCSINVPAGALLAVSAIEMLFKCNIFSLCLFAFSSNENESKRIPKITARREVCPAQTLTQQWQRWRSLGGIILMILKGPGKKKKKKEEIP